MAHMTTAFWRYMVMEVTRAQSVSVRTCDPSRSPATPLMPFVS